MAGSAVEASVISENGATGAPQPLASRACLVPASGQACDPYSAVPFMPDVKTDQQRGDLLDDTRILELAAINRSHARNLRREFHRNLRGIGIIAAYDHIAVHVPAIVAVEHVRRNVVKRGGDGTAFRNKLCRLLGGRAL